MMRFSLLLFLALIVSTLQLVQGQYYYQEPNRIAIKGGLMTSKLSPSKNSVGKENSRNSLCIGAYASFPIKENFHIHADLSYSLKGTKVSNPSAITDGVQRNITFKLNYLEAVGLACYQSGPLYAGGGISLSYLLRAKGKGLDTPDTSGTSWQVSKSDFRKIDAGLAAEFGFKSDTYLIGLRGVYNLLSPSKTDRAKALLPNAKNLNGQIFICAFF